MYKIRKVGEYQKLLLFLYVKLKLNINLKSITKADKLPIKKILAGVLRFELRLVVLETIVLTIDTIPL